MPYRLTLCLAVVCLLDGTAGLAAERFRSHPPVRPLPEASHRPLSEGPAHYVDAEKGDDAADGTRAAPWKTLAHAARQLRPGDTLYLRGGIYWESVSLGLSGKPEAPITIRAYPGELAIVDGGLREFYENPAEAWEPVPDGAPHEYRSTKSYKRGGDFGNFADSMVPLQRYINFFDLRSKNELWHSGLSNRADDPVGIYAGPGLRRNRDTGRIHIRLAHTKLDGLGDRHYRGATDPRTLPMLISGADYAIHVAGGKHLRLQDLVVRGGGRSAVMIADSSDVELDGVTLYGSGSALRTSDCRGIRLVHSFLRGHSAPWHSRGHHKDRSWAGYLAIADGEGFEFARCEFTDHHDGVLMSGCRTMKFHHNLVEHFNDDGLEPGPQQPDHRIEIYQNLIAQCLTALTLHGEHDPFETEPGSGVYVFRNVVDQRKRLYKGAPSEPDPSGAFLQRIGRVSGDHGGPTWPVYYIYHNTFIIPDNSWRGYYGFGWGSHMRGTRRRIFNNIFLQLEGLPGHNYPSVDEDLQADANLLWGLRDGPGYEGDFFADFRGSQKFEASKKRYPPGFGAHDVFADPAFASFRPRSDAPADVRLAKRSPAIDAGLPLPKSWPDPYRDQDARQPDIGALPFGIDPFPIGPAQDRFASKRR